MKRPSEQELRRALDRGEFRLHYQPILSAREGDLVAFEALLRWARPEGGLVSPGVFIPVAEATGFIVPLGRWALRTACATVSKWHKSLVAHRHVGISVNVAPCQWSDPSLVCDVEQALVDSGLQATRLNLEITESSLISDPDAARATLSRLKGLGVLSSIDDFGTGHSSLQYLRDFSVDTLKIDRTFVAGVDTLPECTEIVRAIVNLAHSLQHDVVAEGVETQAQYQRLRQLRCEYVQGFLFAHPLCEEDAERYLQRAASCVERMRDTASTATDGFPLSTDLGYDKAVCLRVITGPAAGQVVEYAGKEIVIGRSPEATLSINDEKLSRFHSSVYRDEEGNLLLADLGSRNGTYCNEQLVDCCPLRLGDRISVGSSSMRVSPMPDSHQACCEEE